MPNPALQLFHFSSHRFMATDLCKKLNVVADALADATVQISLADPPCQTILVTLLSLEFLYLVLLRDIIISMVDTEGEVNPYVVADALADATVQQTRYHSH